VFHKPRWGRKRYKGEEKTPWEVLFSIEKRGQTRSEKRQEGGGRWAPKRKRVGKGG